MEQHRRAAQAAAPRRRPEPDRDGSQLRPILLHPPGGRLGRPRHESDRHSLSGPAGQAARARPGSQGEFAGPELDQGVQHRARPRPIPAARSPFKGLSTRPRNGRNTTAGRSTSVSLAASRRPTLSPAPTTTARSANPPRKPGSAGPSGTGRPGSTTGTSKTGKPEPGMHEALFGNVIIAYNKVSDHLDESTAFSAKEVCGHGSCSQISAYRKTRRGTGSARRLPRIRVAQIAMDYLEMVVRRRNCHQHPYLTLAEAHAAMAYYFDHQAEIDQEIKEEIDASRAGSITISNALRFSTASAQSVS